MDLGQLFPSLVPLSLRVWGGLLAACPIRLKGGGGGEMTQSHRRDYFGGSQASYPPTQNPPSEGCLLMKGVSFASSVERF